MKRNGVTLKKLPDGAPRRLADGRNAWRKMNETQRKAFLEFVGENGGPKPLPLDEIRESIKTIEGLADGDWATGSGSVLKRTHDLLKKLQAQ
jgi:hypothetical protein